MERRPAGLVDGRTLAQQRQHGRLVLAEGRHHQRRVAVGRPGLDLDAGLGQQDIERLHGVVAHGHDQARLAPLRLAHVGVQALGQRAFDNADVIELDGAEKVDRPVILRSVGGGYGQRQHGRGQQKTALG